MKKTLKQLKRLGEIYPYCWILVFLDGSWVITDIFNTDLNIEDDTLFDDNHVSRRIKKYIKKHNKKNKN